MADSTPQAEAVDDNAHLVGWTAQQGSAPAGPDAVPGTVILESELPTKEALSEGGIDIEQYTAGVVVAKDEAEKAAILGENPAAEDYAPKHAADASKSDEVPTGDPAQA